MKQYYLYTFYKHWYEDYDYSFDSFNYLFLKLRKNEFITNYPFIGPLEAKDKLKMEKVLLPRAFAAVLIKHNLDNLIFIPNENIQKRL